MKKYIKIFRWKKRNLKGNNSGSSNKNKTKHSKITKEIQQGYIRMKRQNKPVKNLKKKPNEEQN